MARSAPLGKTISALFIHRAPKAPVPCIASGFGGVGRETHLLDKGMNIDVQYPEIDIDEWRKVYDEFSEPARVTAKWKGLFPDVRHLRLELQLIRINGVRLDKETFTVRPIRPEAGS